MLNVSEPIVSRAVFPECIWLITFQTFREQRSVSVFSIRFYFEMRQQRTVLAPVQLDQRGLKVGFTVSTPVPPDRGEQEEGWREWVFSKRRGVNYYFLLGHPHRKWLSRTTSSCSSVQKQSEGHSSLGGKRKTIRHVAKTSRSRQINLSEKLWRVLQKTQGVLVQNSFLYMFLQTVQTSL